MSDNTQNVTLGQPVLYVGNGGKVKAAYVTATPETLDPETGFAEENPLEEGQVHLIVFSVRGKTSPRYGVSPQTEDGQTQVFRTV